MVVLLRRRIGQAEWLERPLWFEARILDIRRWFPASYFEKKAREGVFVAEKVRRSVERDA